MNKLILTILLIGITIIGFSQEKRNLLQNKATEIGLENTLIRNFSDLDFPNYNNRNFGINYLLTLNNNTFRKLKKSWAATGLLLRQPIIWKSYVRETAGSKCMPYHVPH